ncbi:MAG: protein-L-isoaspartate O-methyltransferase [Candidatus Aenigmarchaeota archaeon]|nr:protein-L-isoaspartate O-methyltransferase [Candidatus Aenigmarchaeota archaeon]
MDFDQQRVKLVERLEKLGYVKTEAISRAMLKVKREMFVTEDRYSDAYADYPLPIPGHVSISAPHMHAIFMSALKLKDGDKVLEIGAGSGILLAYMKEVVGEKGQVFGTEIIPETYEFAKNNLKEAGYDNVKLFLADGSKGLSEFSPFDKIISSASSPENIPKPWIDQIKIGGIIVTPIGPEGGYQDLYYFEKKDGKLIKKNLGGVLFVNLIGEFGFKE